jgi:hypothetical protein
VRGGAEAGFRFEVLGYLSARVDGREMGGVGLDTSAPTAAVRAAMSALNQAIDLAG